MKKILYIILAGLVGLTSGVAFAESKTAILQVYTEVIPVIEYTILHQENDFTITQADINRGYVELSKAVTLSIKTNSRNGYLLVFSAGSGPFSETSVFDGTNAYRLSKTGGEVHIPYQGRKVTKELSFRFYLSSDTRPGTYQWPVAIMVTAI